MDKYRITTPSIKSQRLDRCRRETYYNLLGEDQAVIHMYRYTKY